MPAKKTENEENSQLQKNVRFYHRFMTTPKDAQKSFSNGSFSGTDINPMFRIKILTEVFGPSGFGWWTSNVRYDFTESPETKEVHVFCELDLYVKDPDTGEVSQPIYGIGGNTYIKNWGQKGLKASDEAKKMAYTDALSIACKSLGIGHDIWYSNDRTKYTMLSESPEPQNTQTQPKSQQKQSSQPAAQEPSAPASTESQHTVQSADLISQIENMLAEVGKNMQIDEKKAFAKNTIVPIIGGMNYKACSDVGKLNQLLEKLQAA